jgi:uncharacterized protein
MEYTKIIVLILLILYFLVLQNINNNGFEYYKNLNNKYIINSNFEIKNTSKKGRGLFSLKYYKKGDIIEVCPTLVTHDSNFKNIIRDYIFDPNIKRGFYKDKVFPLGYANLINHCDINKNCTWKISEDNKLLTYYATKPIKAGEEFLTSYGDSYWNSRKKMMKKL